MFDLKTYLEHQREGIDTALSAYIQRLCPSQDLQDALLYCTMAKGKRLRPILCLAANVAVGSVVESALPAACALELIHNYSLIHDDLPALDNDDLRRGQPTCHRQFDEATAILCGDALLNMAFEVLSEAGLQSKRQPAHMWIQVIQIIATASGCRGMIEGQKQDLSMEGVQLAQHQLQKLHQLKTGALIRASVHSGAMLGNATSQQTDHLIRYSDNIGLAFQVVDDILNVDGDPQLLGKAVGSDQLRRKNTYPALMGLQKSQAYARKLVDGALQALTIFDNKADPLRAIANYIVERKR